MREAHDIAQGVERIERAHEFMANAGYNPGPEDAKNRELEDMILGGRGGISLEPM